MSSGVKPTVREMNWGDNALSAPTTPSKRINRYERSEINPAILKAAEGMESLFINHMMDAMRKSVPQNDMNLENQATKIYRGMLDTETSKIAARNGGVGLADQIIAHMESAGYNIYKEESQKRALSAESSTSRRLDSEIARTGGTHEGESRSDNE